jgi:addiction module HigA family antidote
VHRPLHIPTRRRPVPPGEILVREFLEPLGITQAAFAQRVGMTPTRVSEIVHGKRAVTLDAAMRFGRALGTSPDMWLRMQLTLDMYDAIHGPAAAKIARIKPFDPRGGEGRDRRVRNGREPIPA